MLPTCTAEGLMSETQQRTNSHIIIYTLDFQTVLQMGTNQSNRVHAYTKLQGILLLHSLCCSHWMNLQAQPNLKVSALRQRWSFTVSLWSVEQSWRICSDKGILKYQMDSHRYYLDMVEVAEKLTEASLHQETSVFIPHIHQNKRLRNYTHKQHLLLANTV